MTDPVTAAEIVVDTVDVDIQGRVITFLTPDFGQLALIQHQGRILASDNVTGDRAQRALSLVYRSIRSWVLKEIDLDYIDDLVADRALSLEDVLRQIMTQIKTAAEPTKPVARRGRPRKSA